ncbi:MAG: glycosyltransferase family 2 protein [Bacilli bacterium]
MHEKVSVIIPTYNRRLMLMELLRTLRLQTILPYEVIIVNDAGESVDDVEASFPELNVRVLNQATNALHVVARQTGIEAATGDWIMFVDDDDLLVPEHIEHMLMNAGDASFLHCDAELFQYTWMDGVRVPTEVRLFAYETSALGMRSFSTFVPSGSLIRRSLLEVLGALDSTVKHYWDWDLYLRAMQMAMPKRIPWAGVLYAYHGNGNSNQSNNEKSMRLHLDRLIEKHGLGALPTSNFFKLLDAEDVASRYAPGLRPWNGRVFWGK